MSEVIREYGPWIAAGIAALWTLVVSLKLTVALARRASRGPLREAWVNGRRVDPPLVRVPGRARHSRRQMACSVGGTILSSGASIKGVGWTDGSGRGWFAPDADYAQEHGYCFNREMAPASTRRAD